MNSEAYDDVHKLRPSKTRSRINRVLLFVNEALTYTTKGAKVLQILYMNMTMLFVYATEFIEFVKVSIQAEF